MQKLVRPTYPAEFSLGILALIMIVTFLLSHQIFEVPFHELDQDNGVYFGMFMVSVSVIIMFLIIWEEILFPIKVREIEGGGMIFRNHSTKLITQGLIYLSIPVIYGFIYMEYEVNHFRFFMWAGICIVAPILGKLSSGINNYNDFLKMTLEYIQYKNNEKEGYFDVKDIQSIYIIRDAKHTYEKIELIFNNNDKVVIDLDEMELDAFYDSIYRYIVTSYKPLLRETKVV